MKTVLVFFNNSHIVPDTASLLLKCTLSIRSMYPMAGYYPGSLAQLEIKYASIGFGVRIIDYIHVALYDVITTPKRV